MNKKEITFINKLKLTSSQECKSILKKTTTKQLNNSITCIIDMLKEQELKKITTNIAFDFLDSAEFYNLMQEYRWTPLHSQVAAPKAFDRIIEYIKSEISKQIINGIGIKI